MPEDSPVLIDQPLLVEAGLRPMSRLHVHRQLHLLLAGEKGIPTDLIEIEANRVRDRDLADLDELLGDSRPLLGELDPLGAEGVSNLLECLAGRLGILQLLLDLCHREKTTMLAPLDQGGDDLAEFFVHIRVEDRFSCCKAIKRRRLSE